MYHPDCIKPTRSNPLLREVLRVFLKCEDIINDCHKICTTRASEVLVFLFADLDINYKAEIPHACPIAFAFKGYKHEDRTNAKDVTGCTFSSLL